MCGSPALVAALQSYLLFYGHTHPLSTRRDDLPPLCVLCLCTAVALSASRGVARQRVALLVRATAAPARPATPATAEVDTSLTPKQLGFTMPGDHELMSCACLEMVSRAFMHSRCSINMLERSLLVLHSMKWPHPASPCINPDMSSRYFRWAFPGCGSCLLGISETSLVTDVGMLTCCTWFCSAVGEFEKHAGCWMGWPYDKYLWREDVSVQTGTQSTQFLTIGLPSVLNNARHRLCSAAYPIAAYPLQCIAMAATAPSG